MRVAQRVLVLFLIAGLIGIGVGITWSRVDDARPPTETISNSQAGGVQGQATDGASLAGMAVGLLGIASVAILFAAYTRQRG